MLSKTAYLEFVPKEPEANLRFRMRVVEEAATDPEFRYGLSRMCDDDLLFFVNAFCWLYEPRLGKRLPFVTFDFQDDAFVWMEERVGRSDTVTDKSRDMGATWMHLTLMDWCCRKPDSINTFLVLSRKEELVDKRGDPKSLFWKLDFLRRTLPEWLQRPVERRKLHLQYLHNEATIDGESTNEFAGIADRRTGLFLDEYSLMGDQANILRGTRDVTNCRMFAFTPRGAGNTAYKISHSEKFAKQSLHWSLHPEKNVGMYISQSGKLLVLDVDYWQERAKSKFAINLEEPVPIDLQGDFSFHGTAYPAAPNAFDCDFVLDDKLRSPWYDLECERTVNPWEIPQELDICYLGSDYQYFSKTDVLDDLCRRAERPHMQGELVFDQDTVQPTSFEQNAKGRLSLWIVPHDDKILGNDDYVLGSDIGAGTAGSESSNSVHVLYNRKTGEKVAEYVNPGMMPQDFARLGVALARWFNRAFMIWEANGHGRTFGRVVHELGYRNYYHRKPEDNPYAKDKDQSGWWTSRDSKISLLDAYRDALYSGAIVNRSYYAIDECRYYVYRTDGSVVHSKAADTEDGSGAGANHGDRVIADAVANWVIRSVQHKSVSSGQPRIAPRGSAMYRRVKRLASGKESTAAGRWRGRAVA